MQPASSYYPPNPERVPPDLTEMTWPYFLRALVVLVCLVVFVAVYLGMVAGSGYLCYLSFVSMRDPTPMFRKDERSQRDARGQRDGRGQREPARAADARPRQPMNPLLAIAGAAASGLLCLFLLKGFFKFRKRDPKLEVEITEKEQPELFAFLRQLCKDAGAPMPRRVYVSPEVNAAVVYENSILSLFMPTSKNLIIGLGLVNRLNLSELKAVLAHEFGHFAQGSMKFGHYVYHANIIIGDMVYGRDFFDDFLDKMGQSDIRVAIFAKCFEGVIWLLRKGLEGVFYTINFANSSLSRQMEFNADLVAVTLTGSDAIVHALAKLDYAGHAFDLAIRQLLDASDHKLYTRDLFVHQTRAGEFLAQNDPKKKWGTLPALPDDPNQKVQVFEPGDTGIPLMWATHPSNFDREENAKRHYVRSAIDERSAWVLFHEPAPLREKLTRLCYSRMLNIPVATASDPETVQTFIDAENAETTYSPRFHGMYDGRLLDLTGFDLWVHIGMELRDPKGVREYYDQLYGSWLETLMGKKRELDEEYVALSQAIQGGKSVSVRGRTYAGSTAERLRLEVEDELAKIYRRVRDHDRIVFQVHYAMAEAVAKERVDELLARYRFQNGVQQILEKLNETQVEVHDVLGALSGERQLSENQFKELLRILQEAHLTLRTALDNAARLRLPRLQNMIEGQALGEFLLPEPLLSYLPNNTQTVEASWTNRLCQQLALVLDRVRRVHAKSVGGILALQEQIAAAWLAAQPTPAEPASEGSLVRC